jgi:hypothetical protein
MMSMDATEEATKLSEDVHLLADMDFGGDDSVTDESSASTDFSSKESSSTPPTPGSQSKPSASEDFTLIPKILDAKLEKYDTDGALKSTIVKAGRQWTRSRQDNLLVKPATTQMGPDDAESEKAKAMDLLTAISRSGSLPIDASELHIVIAVTHCFENQIMNTVIRDNINPIQKAENSLLMIASTIHNQPSSNLLAAEDGKEEIKG